MSLLTLKVMASLLQLHGPDAAIQSDHPGIDALLADRRGQGAQEGAAPSDKPVVTEAAFRRGGFIKGGPYRGGAFRRAGYVGPYGGFRKGGFARSY
jgi:hypothetical protein